MYIIDASKTPKQDETIGEYIRRLREGADISQQELALAAGIHIQSLGKLERGKTNRLNSKTKKGLAIALEIPSEYLEAVVKGKTVEGVQKKQFCPVCWKGGATVDPVWMLARAKYCLLCGHSLQNNCPKCQQPITSFQHKFCPYCGTSYHQKVGEL